MAAVLATDPQVCNLQRAVVAAEPQIRIGVEEYLRAMDLAAG